MKKILLVLMLFAVGTASAQHWHHRHPEPRTVIVERNDWLAPLIIGGIAGAVIANANNQPQPLVIQQQPVIVQQPQIVCYGWKEIQTSDGAIYRERACYYR